MGKEQGKRFLRFLICFIIVLVIMMKHIPESVLAARWHPSG